MSGKNSGDHLQNHGPEAPEKGKNVWGARARRRHAESKHGGRSNYGRDELFQQKLGAVRPGLRVKADDK